MSQALFKKLDIINSFHLMLTLCPLFSFTGKEGGKWSSQLLTIIDSHVVKCVFTPRRYLSSKLDCPPRPGGHLGSLPPLITQHPEDTYSIPWLRSPGVQCACVSPEDGIMEIPTPRPILETPRSFQALENKSLPLAWPPGPLQSEWTE